MNEYEHEIIVKQIFCFLCSDDIMLKLLRFDSYSYFQVLGKCFCDKNLYNIVNSDYNNEKVQKFIEIIGLNFHNFTLKPLINIKPAMNSINVIITPIKRTFTTILTASLGIGRGILLMP